MGFFIGWQVGCLEGNRVGISVGRTLGRAAGIDEGKLVGLRVGIDEGCRYCVLIMGLLGYIL